MRPRDHGHQILVGEAPGEATFYLVEDFHGFSTMIESHARAARTEFGKGSQALTLPVTTLAALCEQHAPAAIDFLKVDVEGAEKEVLFGGDWQRFRPKVVVVEALAPHTLAPAWEAFEPFLIGHGYRSRLVRHPQPLLPGRGGRRAWHRTSRARRPRSRTP